MKKIKRKEIIQVLQKKENLKEYDLKKADFSRLDLSDCDLSSLDLSGAKFKHANLEKANLSKSIIDGSSFIKARLNEANLREIQGHGTDFSMANLSGADLSQAVLQDIVVYKTIMRGVIFDKAQLKGVDLSATDLTECEANGSNFQRANLGYSSLDGANLKAADFEDANLSDIKAKNAIFSESRLVDANLEGAILDGSDFSQADMTKANLSLTSLEGINLDDAKLVDTNFRLSRGIAEGKKEYLRQQGAKVPYLSEKAKKIAKVVFKTPLGFAALGIFLFAVVMGIYFYFTNINHLSIPSLTEELIKAKESKQYEKALRINQILIKKLGRIRNKTGVFARTLDVARMHRVLGNREKSMEYLEGMLREYQNDSKQNAQIRLEIALNYKDAGNFDKAITLMEDIETHNLAEGPRHSLGLNLARAYWEEKD